MSPELAAYAENLKAAGFTVYLPADGRPLRFFHYSQVVGEQTCYGTVCDAQFSLLGQPFEHAMPIRPTNVNGSSMYIITMASPASVDYARAVAQPRNWNDQVGTQTNHKPWGIGSTYLPA